MLFNRESTRRLELVGVILRVKVMDEANAQVQLEIANRK